MTKLTMALMASFGLAGTAGTAAAQVAASAHADHIACAMCEGWNQPQKPFRIVGNTYYVGTRELSSVLITGAKGHVLIDAPLPQSAAIIAQNIEALGFKLKDVKLILNSHAHFDHAGALAELQRLSGATVAASANGARALEAGTVGTDDPQYDAKEVFRIPKVPKVRPVADGETLKVGKLAVKANYTPGHTPGGTSWTWISCEKGRCYDVVYADSLNPISTDGFLFTSDEKGEDRSASFKASIDRVAALKCDVIVAAHPGFTDTLEKNAARTAGRNPFIEGDGCRAYAADAGERLRVRLAKEKAGLMSAPK